MSISVREAKQRLDAKLFLDEIPRWHAGGPHHVLLYQRMFKYAKGSSLKEYHQGIYQGHWQFSPERCPQEEVSAMGLLTPEMALEEILALYQEVYQLKREPAGVQCTEDMVGETHIEILEVIKACLQHRWSSYPPVEPRQIPRTSGEAQLHPYEQPSHGHFGQ